MICWIAALIATLSSYAIINYYKGSGSKSKMSSKKYHDVEYLTEDEDENESGVKNEVDGSGEGGSDNFKILPTYGKRKGLFDWESGRMSPDLKKISTTNAEQSQTPGFIELTDDESDKSISPTRASTRPLNRSIKTEVPQVLIHNVLMISKVTVDLPVKPYPCQTAVMGMLIKGCTNKQNCLLESPTGSGKTLALLCSALAWQDHFSKEVAKDEEKLNSEIESKLKNVQASIDGAGSSNGVKKDNEMDLDADDGFLNLSKAIDEMAPRTKVPKIYYGSRTHKQIEQVIKELKKTAYSHKPMTILSSREHSCIQQTTGKKSKTQLCNELLDPLKKVGCPYYTDKNKNGMSSNVTLRHYGIDGPWDVEDLVQLGKDIGCCPYFSARQLMAEADIIFCPYNYIIDPQIRDTMQLDLKDQIIILDEAHNIEDICRDVASKTIREDELEECIKECINLEVLVRDDLLKSTYNTIYEYCKTLINFLKNQLVTPINGGEESCSAYWKGDELMQLLEINKLGKPMMNQFIIACKKVIIEYNNAKENIRDQMKKAAPIIISINTKRLLEDLLFVIEKISSIKFSQDFRACVTETEVRDYKLQVEDDVWIRGSRPTKRRIRMLKLLCMFPGVIFKPLSDLARSIILASGTLAPINSFQSELGTTFPNMLQANHVIPQDQVYVRGIAHGPTGIGLKANYQNTNLFNFKDELGRLLVQVCESIPHGVLCFFSSYKMMNLQIERWKETAVWQQLENNKHILVEPRFGNELDEVMTEFRTVIKDTSNPNRFGVTGALLFAVFRGKVAEGIDFSDNEARCVLTVGIPFAVRNDPSIDMKMMYNNLNKIKGLLSGSDWYSIQAFRALNQALGRCIRHKNDWGAVLVVDERFVSNATVSNLPKWVKSMWRNPSRVNLPAELKEFVKIQKIQEEERLHL